MIELNNNKIRNNILKLGSKNLNTENWEVYHPNGTHMFTCGEKKATWYLERGLATRTEDGKIMLTFEPKGSGFETNEIFGRSAREAICVVTGVDDGLQRHHIVPYCYRTYFPEAFKSKNHHDIVLINHKKHSEYEQQATLFKDKIARIFDVKTISELNIEYINALHSTGKEKTILLNTIYSLFKSYGKVSEKIKYEKLQIISMNIEIPIEIVSKYNYIQLYKLYLLLKDKNENDLYLFKQEKRKLYDHGYHVVQKLNTDEKIINFVKLWRNHFIDIMQPQFMPIGWSVDFRIKTKI
jgi:hypothetical protein